MVAIWYVQIDWTCEDDYKENKESEQSSPFRRWTTGSGASSSYRQQVNKMSEMSAPQLNISGAGDGGPSAQRPHGGVTRWSLGLDQLLEDPVGRAAFAEFLAREYALENIKFWCACEVFKGLEEDDSRAMLAKTIWERHLADEATDPVNVDASARRVTDSRRHDRPVPRDLFSLAQRQVFDTMNMDPYRRFLRSDVHAECARADLRGLPPPPRYGLARNLTPPPSAAVSAPTTPNRVQKSSSNASDRRRSGGSSLLPWRIRAPTRERVGADTASRALPDHTRADRQPTATAAEPAEDASSYLRDVVRSRALCRVVLPDGATSVVGVEPTMPVRHLVDHLLQRRNLLLLHYDVLLRDEPGCAGKPVDVDAASTVLGGREVVIERRCIVRIEVRGRVVAVRCRGARRLRHVLRPVLARYAPAAPTAHSAAPAAPPPRVLRDGVPLHPDTTMLELDGARLQVVEGSEGSAGDALEGPSEEDDAAFRPCVPVLASSTSDGHTDRPCFNPLPDRGRGGGNSGAELGATGAKPSAGATGAKPSAGATGAKPSAGATGAKPSAGATGAKPSAGANGAAPSAGAIAAAPSAGDTSSLGGVPGTSNADPASQGVCPGGTGAYYAPQVVIPGRVRAALKPGTPVHSSHTDVLDNLCVSRRAWPQSKTPPPLPPKPAQPSRAPTLV